MKVELGEYSCTVTREPGDPRFSNGGWGSAESRFLYHVLKALKAQGYDVIKKRMQADGHLYGNADTQYIRTRSAKSPKPHFCVYDGSWQIRNLVEDFRKDGKVYLAVEREIFPESVVELEGDALDEALSHLPIGS